MFRLASLAVLVAGTGLLAAQVPASYIPAAERPEQNRSAEAMRQMREALRAERERQRRSGGEMAATAPVAQQRAPQPAAENPAPANPAPESQPANPPRVQYQNGLLSIQALNSNLGDILAQVRAQTGATIETPPGGANERVVVRLGPAPPAQVLEELLHGSRFDYIILGSAGQPGAVEQVILSHRGPPPTRGPVVHSRAFVPEPEPEPDPTLDEGMGDFVPPEPPAPEQPAEQTAPAPGQPYSPGRPIGGEPQVRTPEELLKELQRLQQEQQQQQQQRPRPEEPDEPNL